MKFGRRAEYRVELSETTDLAVAVTVPNGSPIGGQLLDVSASGAGVLFDTPNPPNLVVGQHIDLVFTSDTLKEPLQVAACVQHRAEDTKNGARRYGFRFLEPQQLDTRLPADARRLFNRRQEVRVTPDTFQPVRVTLQSSEDQPPVEVQLLNISLTGLGVSLEPTLESLFADSVQVSITIDLPGVRRPVGVVGHIRYRRLVGDRIHYGIEFDTELSPRFARTEDLLSKYVSRRQADYMRESA